MSRAQKIFKLNFKLKLDVKLNFILIYLQALKNF